MNLGRYIFTLLHEHEIVIIPGFGAFISEYKSAELDEKSGEISPPTKTIYFEPKIQHNDGLLMEEVARAEKLQVKDALQKIEKERDKIIFRLDKGEEVTLENTGVLFTGKENEIKFNSFTHENLLLETYGLGNISLNKDNAEIKIPDESGNVKQHKKDYQYNNEKEHTAFIEHESVLPNRTSNKKKKKSRLWILFILIPLIAGGIFYIINDKKNKPDTITVLNEPVSQKEISKPEIILSPSDSTIIDSSEVPTVDSLVVMEEVTDTAVYLSPDPTKFYLVTGSFKEQENSFKHIRHLKNKGLKPFYLGKQGNFHIVGIGIYNTEDEAFSAQYDFLEKYPGSGVWIYHKE